jgi:hypothetical protein
MTVRRRMGNAKDTLSQAEINQAEWNKPDNWSGFGPYRAYFSKRDSRFWIPRFFNNRLAPHAINLGHRYGFLAWSLFYYALIAMVAVGGYVIAAKN